MAHIFIGIGSSFDREKNIKLALSTLKENFGEIHFSSVFESEAVGFEGSNFYNLVAEFYSELPINELIKQLKSIELMLGRPVKAIKNAPRGIDLDLLLYDQYIDLSVNVPRSDIIEHAFVLQPLAELAPTLLHPVLQQRYQALWQAYPRDKQRLWKIELPFIE